MPHTPTPWAAQDDDIWCVDDDGHQNAPLFHAAREYRRWGREVSGNTHVMNAVFVARAVNSHADLVAAMHQMLFLFGRPDKDEYVDGGATYKLACETVARARDALIKAEQSQ